jgi:hypothetical protein
MDIWNKQGRLFFCIHLIPIKVFVITNSLLRVALDLFLLASEYLNAIAIRCID